MRRGLLLAGLVLIVLGLLLVALPAFPSAPQHVYVPSAGAHALVEDMAPFDLLFPRVAFSLAWISTANGTNLIVYACGTDPACPFPPASPVAEATGSSGTLSFLGSANEYYLVVPQHGAVTLTVTESGPYDGGGPGLALLLVGLGLGAGGLTGRRRRNRLRGAAGPSERSGTAPVRPPGRSGQA
ncbi:MAG: hypothetical protein ACYDFT_08285 [Thermoplasmata archaeon]